MTKQDARIKEHMLVKSLAEQKSVKESDIQILEWSTTAGSGDTDNFATDMVAIIGKADVKGSTVSFSYMAKVLPNGEMRKQMVKHVSHINDIVFISICETWINFSWKSLRKSTLSMQSFCPWLRKLDKKRN